jgi:adenylate cyclase
LNINSDEVISFFGDECSNPELKAILSYYDSVKMLNEYLQSIGILKNIIGTGINSGEIVIGNFGSEDRMFYSIMGEHVNFANRLLNSNKLYETNIIISDFTYQRIKNELVVRELDTINVFGLKEPHKIYEVLSVKYNF